jgi:hypothetical protein
MFYSESIFIQPIKCMSSLLDYGNNTSTKIHFGQIYITAATHPSSLDLSGLPQTGLSLLTPQKERLHLGNVWEWFTLPRKQAVSVGNPSNVLTHCRMARNKKGVDN